MDFSGEEFDEILKIFLAESEEIIAELNNNLLLLEKNPEDTDALFSLFRNSHSLKGAARMVGFTNIQNIAHKTEDILGLAKDKKITIDGKITDILYKTIDFLSDLIKKTIANKGEITDIDISSEMRLLN